MLQQIAAWSRVNEFTIVLALEQNPSISETSLTPDIAVLKEKVRNLEVYTTCIHVHGMKYEIVCVKLQTIQVRLCRKIQEKDKEIKQKSSEISLTSESQYGDTDGFFKSSVSPQACIQSPKFLSREPSGDVSPHVHTCKKTYMYLMGPDKLYCDPWTALFRAY